MKHLIIYTYIMLLIGILLPSCTDFLDKTPDEDLTIDMVFEQRRYAERFLAAAYAHLPLETNFHEWPINGRNPFIGASDEMEVTWDIAFSQQMNSGAWNASNLSTDIWSVGWQGSRKVNIFLENIQKTPMDDTEKAVMIGEAKFLRAFFHFFILRAYGAIPIMDYSYVVAQDFNTIERAPFETCIDFIVQDCNEAAAVLPLKRETADYGRPSRAAALALKARVLLYAASPLYNGNPDFKNFTNKDGTRLYPDFNKDKWMQAASAAKECIDQCEPTYKLHKSASNDGLANYKEVFTINWNDEVFFARNDAFYDFHERCANPRHLGGLSGYSPTQEIVDAYEMNNGIAPITGYDITGEPLIDVSSGYTETGFAAADDPKGYYSAGVSNMYVGRDPRFYASIIFNGANWKGHRVEFWYSGKDGQQNGKTDYTKTGYLLKKYLDPSVNIIQSTYVSKTWIYFRLAEQYLNYAEAINEAEGPAKAYPYVNAIRNRANMPDLPSGLSQDEMREKIRHERRIELAFETHRYFDCHRWKIADKTESGNIHGMNISEGSYLQDLVYYKRMVVEKRVFESPKHYLFPIPQDDINKSSMLIQNIGW